LDKCSPEISGLLQRGKVTFLLRARKKRIGRLKKTTNTLGNTKRPKGTRRRAQKPEKRERRLRLLNFSRGPRNGQERLDRIASGERAERATLNWKIK